MALFCYGISCRGKIMGSKPVRQEAAVMAMPFILRAEV